MAIITVTTLNDSVADDDQVSLREAIQAANDDTSVDGSVAGSGADTIVFAAGLNGTIRLDGGDGAGGTAGSTLSITEAVIIDGDGRITISGDANNNDVSTGGHERHHRHRCVRHGGCACRQCADHQCISRHHP